jgi:hypothetical protein
MDTDTLANPVETNKEEIGKEAETTSNKRGRHTEEHRRLHRELPAGKKSAATTQETARHTPQIGKEMIWKLPQMKRD